VPQFVGKDVKTRIFQTYEIGMIPIVSFVKIQSAANPYDLADEKYFAN